MKVLHKVIVNLWNKIYAEDDVKVTEIVSDCNDAIENKKIRSDKYEL